VAEFFSNVSTVFNFIRVSAKRRLLFSNVQKAQNLDDLALYSLSDTRWVCRGRSVHVFLIRFTSIVHTLGLIKETDGKAAVRVETSGMLTSILNFQFIFLLHALDTVLGKNLILNIDKIK
jgi:hypothetical protein